MYTRRGSCFIFLSGKNRPRITDVRRRRELGEFCGSSDHNLCLSSLTDEHSVETFTARRLSDQQILWRCFCFAGLTAETMLPSLGFYHLSSFRCSDLGCWVYYENTLPSPPRSEH